MEIKHIPILNIFNVNDKHKFYKKLLALVLSVFSYSLIFTQTLFAQSLAQGGGGISQSSYAVSADGKVYGWGGVDSESSSSGTFGSATPVVISNAGALAGKTIVSIASGRYHTLGLDSEGKVYSWGVNNSASSVEVAGLSGITAIAVGHFHSLALKSDGTVYAWGDGSYGQLGNGQLYSVGGSSFSSLTPLQVSISGVSAISAGTNHSIALKSDGTVYTWGNNTTALPKKADNLSDIIAVAGGDNYTIALKSDGSVFTWGDGGLGNGTYTSSQVPVQVNNLSDVTAIAGGTLHSLALKSDGTVYAWGYNESGALGNGTNTNSAVPVKVTGLSHVIAIAGGLWHSLAIKSDGTVYAWGANTHGQLGNGVNNEELSEGSSVPLQVPILLTTSHATPSISLPGQMFYVGQKFIMGIRKDNNNGTGNYTAQLSDATGSFGSPVTIGNSLGYAGTYLQFSGTIPADTPPGIGYRIRILDSDAEVFISDNGVNLNINASPAPTTWQVFEDFEQPNPWPWLPWGTPGNATDVTGTLSSSAAHTGNYGIQNIDWAQTTEVILGNPGDKISMWVKNEASLGFRSHFLETHYFAMRGNKISFHYIPGYIDYSWRELTAAEFISEPDKWYRMEVTFVEKGFVEGRVYDADGVTELAYLKSMYYHDGKAGIAMRGRYIDDISYYIAPPNSIATATLSDNAFCKGQALKVPFVVTGYFSPGNTFTAQLSNSEGSFSSPINIGTIIGTASGTISATIPANTPTGAGYRIRVISSGPVITGADNGINLMVNVAPTLSTITAPTTPVQLNSSISASATFSGTKPKIASWNWGDGQTSVAEINGPSISGNHIYASKGVYIPTLTIEDACGQKASSDYHYVVAYNLMSSFIAGSGFIHSPSGALRDQPDVNGLAIFGFVAENNKGKTADPGEFQFKVGNFAFKSTSYNESSVKITGNKAQYEGQGSIAGRHGTFGFMVLIQDGKHNGGTEQDRFRVRIWELLPNGGEGNVVYDNLLTAKQDQLPANYNLSKDSNTVIVSGSIIIQNSPAGKKSERMADEAELATIAPALRTYPNPFQDKTTVEFALDKDEAYTLDVYDLKGSFVKHLQKGKAKAGTLLQATWEPKQSAKGVYLIRLVTQNKVQHIRVIRD